MKGFVFPAKMISSKLLNGLACNDTLFRNGTHGHQTAARHCPLPETSHRLSLHPGTEAITGIDLVREQIRLAAGEGLRWQQADVPRQGCAILCRFNAKDPWRGFMPSPGQLSRVRLPGGPGVRLDTYVYTGCRVPDQYDSLIAKLTVWAEERRRPY